MAWTTISNALVAVGAKPFASTIQALRDNTPAAFEGLTGAPRLYLAALQRLTAGATVRVSRTVSDTSGSSGGISVSQAYGFMQAGDVRFTLTTSGVTLTGAINTTITRLRAGTSTTVAASSSTSPRVVDLSVLPGDSMTLTASGTAGGGGGTITLLHTIGTGGEEIFPTEAMMGRYTTNVT